MSDLTNEIPEEYKPISMWGYFGYEILFSIPIIGWIFLIVKAIGAKNKNVKNFARSYFCLFVIAIIAAIIGVVITGGSFADFFSNVVDYL